MPSNETNSATNPGRKLITLATTAAISVIAVILLGAMTAQAQSGAVPNLQLSSASPGALTISWDAPDPAPSDYRIIWAKQDLDFPSYKAANEANRGNEYPGGTETSITLTGLAGGETFKARMRARYTSGGQNNGSWSGPWTGAATARVKDNPPAAPTGLTTSGVSHDSMTIRWAAPSSGSAVTGYRVLRGTNANSLSTIAQNTGSTAVEYTDSTVAADTTYHYAVLALSQDGDGARSTTVSTATPAEPQPVPSAPTGLTTYQVVHDSVTISWTTPSQGSVTGYRILRGTDSNSLSVIVQNTDSTATQYTDSTVTAETTYPYAVLALSAEGVGAQSAAVSATTPAAPQQATVPDLRLSSTAAGQLTISWDALDPTPSDYRILWAKQGLDFPSYTAANEANRGNEYPGGTETSITLTGLAKGETFRAQMRARHTSGGDNNGAWSGPWSDTVTARVKDDLPTAPTGLTASRVTHDSVTLSWTAPTQGTVTGYRIFRGTDADSLAAIVQDTGNTSTEYTDSTVAAETTYHYAVLALSQDGDGAQSATVNATTPAEPRSKKDDPKGTPDTDRLQRGANDATGKPTISASNVFRVPAVLFAGKGSIADTDGLPTESSFTWQSVRVDGSTETDIAGATGRTYTLTAADVGKKIKVKASFTDAAINSEGPLKSDATATITAASSCNSPSQVRRASRYVNTGTLMVGKSGSDYGFSPSAARSAFDNGHFWAERGVFTAHSMMVITGGHLRLETTFEMEEPTRNYFTLYVCDQQFDFKDATVSRISMPGRRHDGNQAYGSRLTWRSSDLDWSGEAQRTIHFYRDSTAPTVVSVEITELTG